MTTMTHEHLNEKLEMKENIIRCLCGEKIVAFNEEEKTEELLNSFNGHYIFEDKGQVVCEKCGSTLAYEVDFDLSITIGEAKANVEMTRIVFVPVDDGISVNINEFYEGDYVNLDDGSYLSEGMLYEVKDRKMIKIYNGCIDSKQMQLQLN